MVHIKDGGVCAYRTLTQRNVEDWREESSTERLGQWAVHCLDHDQRAFVDTYRKAKDSASMPAICPVCEIFDQRCVYCPSDRDQWKVDPAIGFTRSTGHIMGNAVCFHHRYGSIPEGIDYLEITNVVLAKPVVEVFIGHVFIGSKVATVEYMTGDRQFWIRLYTSSVLMTTVSACPYQKALGFALNVACSLNESLIPIAELTFTPRVYETWEAAASRRGQQEPR
jgi:hypothetical protein